VGWAGRETPPKSGPKNEMSLTLRPPASPLPSMTNGALRRSIKPRPDFAIAGIASVPSSNAGGREARARAIAIKGGPAGRN
jgi:hypothetical protein